MLNKVDFLKLRGTALLDALRIRYSEVSGSIGFGDLLDHYVFDVDGASCLIDVCPPSLAKTLEKSGLDAFSPDNHSEDKWQKVNSFVSCLTEPSYLGGDLADQCWEIAYKLYCEYEEEKAPECVSVICDPRVRFELVEKNCYFIEMSAIEIMTAVLSSKLKLADMKLKISQNDRRDALIECANLEVRKWLLLADTIDATVEDVIFAIRSEQAKMFL